MLLRFAPNTALGSKRRTALLYICKCDKCADECIKYPEAYTKSLEKYDGKIICKSCAVTQHNRFRDPEIHAKMVESVARNRRGKTYDDIFGEEKSAEIRVKFSEAQKGENNNNYGGRLSHGFADNPLSGPWEKRFGKEEADRRKSAISLRQIGSGNPMFGKPAPIGSGAGWSGWYKGFYFYSLLELSCMIFLESKSLEYRTAHGKETCVQWKNELGVDKTYFPDFVLSSGDILEIKPARLINTKINAEKFHHARIKFGDKFRVLTENDFPKITKCELLSLLENGTVKLLNRYMEKLKNYDEK